MFKTCPFCGRCVKITYNIIGKTATVTHDPQYMVSDIKCVLDPELAFPAITMKDAIEQWNTRKKGRCRNEKEL